MKRKMIKLKMWIKWLLMKFNPYKNMKHMFTNVSKIEVCESLKYLDTKNITNMKHMFDV